MSGQILLSLRAWEEPDPTANALPIVIPQIKQQRGSFRDVSEAALEEEIAAASAEKPVEETDAPKEDEVLENAAVDQAPQIYPREAIAIKRHELQNKIYAAQQECLFALDFVSLLLSAVRPQQAQLTMSPAMKEAVPLGSLGIERIQDSKARSLMDEEAKVVTRGWKSQSVNAAADSLMAASKRLTTVVEGQTRYWGELVKIKEAGWTLCRLPREPQSMGVRYGFSDAGADEKYFGIGAIRKNPEGEVTMDDLNSAPRDKVVRISVIRNGLTTGVTHVVPAAETTTTATTINNMISRARDAVYENELFLEILREARTLANLGIRTSEDSVAIDFAPNSRAIIELVSTDDASPISNKATDDGLAQTILTSLHLLLSHAHKQTLKRRRQPPPPISLNPRPNPPLLLLRPIATHLFHNQHVSSFTTFLQNLISLPTSAGLPSNFTFSPCHNSLSRPITGASTTVEAFLGTLESIYTINLPGSWKLGIQVQTIIGPPLFGTRYVVTTSHDGSCAVLMGNNSFTSEKELGRYMQWCLERGVVNGVQERATGWKQVGLGNEMSKSDGGEGEYKRVRIEIEDGMSVKWTSENREEVYVWDGSEGKRTMDDILERI